MAMAFGDVRIATPARAAAVPASTTGWVRARKFMTYFAPAPATKSSPSTAHGRGFP
jgi:hypothetical protein